MISQDEQTCVVYGMPKSAVSTGRWMWWRLCIKLPESLLSVWGWINNGHEPILGNIY
ncbi:MAG: hypothetical protein ACOX4M_08845 [Acetivibrionales bacterium]